MTRNPAIMVIAGLMAIVSVAWSQDLLPSDGFDIRVLVGREVSELPEGPLSWRIDTIDTLEAAEAAASTDMHALQMSLEQEQRDLRREFMANQATRAQHGAQAQEAHGDGTNVRQLATGLAGGSGSAIGPDGALHVTETAAGRISRIDTETGEITTFAEGLPKELIGIGGAMDVAFIGNTAYALVTLVGEDVGGSDIVGIYRVDGPDSFTVVADIGAFSSQNVPTNAQIDVPSGVQYAMEPHGEGFLVTDGHHNRLLEVTVDGEVTEVMGWGNTVPTGLAMSGGTIFMAEAGPIPHTAEDGRIVSLGLGSPTVSEVASGARLIVDVEFGPDRRLYAIAQGDWTGGPEGSPADPNSGSLLEVEDNGTFTRIVGGLNLPTSLEFVGDTAYVVTLTGEILAIDVP